MKTVFKDSWVDGLLNQGRAEMLLELLEMRFSVPDDIRKRVQNCTDAEQIKTWFRRVPSAASLDEVFAELPARSSLAACRLLRHPATAAASSPSPPGHPTADWAMTRLDRAQCPTFAGEIEGGLQYAAETIFSLSEPQRQGIIVSRAKEIVAALPENAMPLATARDFDELLMSEKRRPDY